MLHLDALLPAVLHGSNAQMLHYTLGVTSYIFEQVQELLTENLLSTGKSPCDFEHGRPNSDFRFPQCKSSTTPLPLAGLDQIYAAVIQREIWPIELGKDFSFYLSLVSPWEGSISCHCPVYPTGLLLKSIPAGRQPTGSSKVEKPYEWKLLLQQYFSFFFWWFCRQEVCRLCTKICSFKKGQGFFEK